MCSFSDIFLEKGYACFYGYNAKQLSFIDNHLKSWITDIGGNEYHIPALIDKNVLEKCGYFNSFPQHLTIAAYVKPEYYGNVIKDGKIMKEYIDIEEKYFTPAACLHIYPILEGRNNENNEAITTLARVYRYEQGKFEGFTRLWDFTVREFVFVGTKDYVLNMLEEIKVKSLNFAINLGMKASIVEANDHFYPSRKNMVKAKIQKANSLKYELSIPIQGNEVSVASFNFHETHFSKSFNFDDNGKIVTGCVGFGLERWIAALIEYNIDMKSIDLKSL